MAFLGGRLAVVTIALNALSTLNHGSASLGGSFVKTRNAPMKVGPSPFSRRYAHHDQCGFSLLLVLTAARACV